MLGFDFPEFDSARKLLREVTTPHLPARRQQKAKRAVIDAMYPRGDGRRHFRNLTQFIIGQESAWPSRFANGQFTPDAC